MNSIRILGAAALAAAVALPIGALAQSAPASPPPHAARMHHRHHRRGAFRNLNLTAQQRAQLREIREQFRQSHPRGTRPTVQERQQFRARILQVLTPQQQAQLKADRAKWRAEHPRKPGGGSR